VENDQVALFGCIKASDLLCIVQHGGILGRIINFKLAEALCVMYALLIILFAVLNTGIILLWPLVLFIFPYIVINFKYLLNQKYMVRISNLLIIVLIVFQITENLIVVIQFISLSLITFTMNSMRFLMSTLKGFALLMIGIRLNRAKSYKKSNLFKADLILLGISNIILGLIMQIPILSYITKLGVPPNALLIVSIISQTLYIVLLLMMGILFRSSRISIIN